jgi:hypothetical protein
MTARPRPSKEPKPSETVGADERIADVCCREGCWFGCLPLELLLCCGSAWLLAFGPALFYGSLGVVAASVVLGAARPRG